MSSIPKMLERKFIDIGDDIIAVLPIILLPFARFIYKKIWSEYIWQTYDILWLNDANSFWNQWITQLDAKKAIDQLIQSWRIDNLDPYELIIDAFDR